MKIILFLSLLPVLFSVSSCSNDNNNEEQTYEKLIVGEWQQVPINDEYFLFKSDNTFDFIDKSETPISKAPGVWRINSDTLYFYFNSGGEFEGSTKFLLKTLNDNILVFEGYDEKNNLTGSVNSYKRVK